MTFERIQIKLKHVYVYILYCECFLQVRFENFTELT